MGKNLLSNISLNFKNFFLKVSTFIVIKFVRVYNFFYQNTHNLMSHESLDSEKYMIFSNAVEKGNLFKVIFLIETGADIDKANIYGLTPLMKAVIHNQSLIMLYLLKCKANILIRSDSGATALQWAVSYSRIDMLKTLLQYSKLDLNHHYEEGNTLLLNAIFANNLLVVKWLVDNGAMLDELNNEGQSPLTLASQLKREEILKFLEEFVSRSKHIYDRKKKKNIL